MVSEGSSTLSPNISHNPDNWLSVKITKMPTKTDNIILDEFSISIRVDSPSEDNPKHIVEDIVSEIFEFALEIAEGQKVMTRDTKLTRQDRILRRTHRNTSVLDDEEPVMTPIECRNNFVNNNLRRKSISASEINTYGIDENDHKVVKSKMPYVTEQKNVENKEVKKKKKLSFNALFHKKDKHKNKDPHHKLDEDSETYDHFPQLPIFKSNTLAKTKKYASAVELSNKVISPAILQRTPSFIKKLAHITEDSSNFLRRSLSFRDSTKKKEKSPSKEKISEIKNQEWKQSLQSLVESDISVSYKDLSFVDYDALNQCKYEDGVHLTPCSTSFTRNGYIGRTQSMSEKRSPDFRPAYQRLSSATESYRSSLCLSDCPGALSLPALHHIEPENAETPSDESPPRLYQRRRRPPSASSEDSGVGSFRSAGAGKLRRHNATRQKSRYTFIENRQPLHRDADQTVNALFDIVRLLAANRAPQPGAKRAPAAAAEKEAAGAAPAPAAAPSPPEGHHEWRRFVGSIRRKVQRHASSSSREDHSTKSESSSRKNSLTKSNDEGDKKRTLTKQKSIGLETPSSKSDYFKALSFKDRGKSSSSRNIDAVSGRSEKKKGEKKDVKPTISFSRSKSSSSPKGKDGTVKQDDFLKATMRIFLVVSPPAGKMQVRSRSLTHLDALESRRQGAGGGGPGGGAPAPDSALKDARSEPDCARPLPSPDTPLAAAGHKVGAGRPTAPPKRHVLSRSQKSSSECFSVNFEVGEESTWDNELFFPAQRGITLHDSLAKLCELRNIDLSSCDARLQDKENNVESLVHFSQDTASLVGRQVRITAKDASNKKLPGSFSNHSRKPSGSYKPRTSSFFSSSTEEGAGNVGSSTLSLASEADQSKRQIKQRLTAFFGNSKDTKYEALIDQLDKYSKQGIPQNVTYPEGQCESIDALYKLENDWRDIIGSTDLNEKLQQQQTALWELIKTEVAYIKTLKVVTDLFLACLKDLQSKNLLKEIDTEKLFSNITEILGANVIFWRNTLFPLVRDMRRYRLPSCIENMLEGFSKVHDTFQPYFKYCAEQSRCQHYCRENLDSEVFTAYLTWCESQKDCNRLRLMDILVQPMQRLTKYGLLLKALLKNTEEDIERESLQTMIKMVDDFVNSVNSSLKHRQDNERLKGIIARIESYDIVESKDDDLEKILKKDKSLTQLDLTRPMLGCLPERKRHLLLEGDLKLKDSLTSKMEVHCFLLTDMLLVCKPSAKRGSGAGGGATMRVVRQPYLVDRLVVAELTRETPSLAVIYKNEFDMAVAAFILQSSDAKKIRGWKEGISKAQALYAQARQPAYQEDSLEEYCTWSECVHGAADVDLHGLQPAAPRSPLATSSRASRVSSLAHSHSGSVEMNDQSSVGSRAVSVADTDNRTGSVSSDEGAQPLPADRAPRARPPPLRTPNTLSVQPHGGALGQSLPNLSLGSPRVDVVGGGGQSGPAFQHTLSVPGGRSVATGGQHLLSPTHRGVSYPPPSPTRGNLRRSLAVQGAAAGGKHPPLVKTRQAHAATASPGGSLSASVSLGQAPAGFDFDVPVIAGVYQPEDCESSFNRGQHRQAMKRTHRYHTAGLVDDIKKNDARDNSIHKRLSWNCTGHPTQQPPGEQSSSDQT